MTYFKVIANESDGAGTQRPRLYDSKCYSFLYTGYLDKDAV